MDEVLQGKKFKCAFCGGTGVQPRSLKSRCLACRGKGEVELERFAVICPSCKGKGKSSGTVGLACICCKGVGVVKKEAVDALAERLGEVAERFSWMRKETKKKTKEIEKRLKPIKIKEVSARGGSALGEKKETAWIEKLRNNLKKTWWSL